MSRALVEQMRDTAARLLSSFDEEARSAGLAPFHTPDRQVWTYLPGPRPGLMLGDLDEQQQHLVMRLVDTGLSGAGARTARGVMELDGVLRELEREEGHEGWERRRPDHYWFRILGDPAGEVWAWHLAGHHLAVHLTVVRDEVAGTPLFFGANPAVVPRGRRTGWQALRPEEGLARDLLEGLDPDQRRVAVVSSSAPDDISTRSDPVADPAVVPAGLARADMDGGGRRRLDGLVRCYLGRVHDDVADAAWDAVVQGGLDDVTFAWAGSMQSRQRHYYAIRGSTFLIEYDNTQNGANHVHTVWRDLRRDWGADLLAAHHASSH
jgi:hypothetical protein